MLQSGLLRSLRRCRTAQIRLSRCCVLAKYPEPSRWSSTTTPNPSRPDTDNSIPNILHKYKNSLSFAATSNQDAIAKLRFSEEVRGQIVTLHGYLGHTRTPSKKLTFVEFFGPELDEQIQIVSVIDVAGQDVHESLRNRKAFTPVVIKGEIELKSAPTTAEHEKQQIPNEIRLWDIKILNEFPKDLDISGSFGPDQRHLQLKSKPCLRQALKFRSQIYHAACTELIAQGYQHIETPVLFKSTSEGAREFLVPTRQKGFAYALPQSPQQYKQLLIASGIPKYFQMARCFRDEDMRADRQPEFTQLDLERAFASGKDIMADVEQLVRNIVQKIPPPYGETTLRTSQDNAFETLTYYQAMSKYGTDKPDLRLNYSIERIDHLLPADLISKISPLNAPAVDISIFRAPDSMGSNPSRMREFVSTFLDAADATVYNENPHGGPGIFIYDSQKPLSGLQAFGFEAAEEVERLFEPEEGDLLVIQARPSEDFTGGSTALGRLMVDLNKSAMDQNLKTVSNELKFLWVVDFPLFTPIPAGEADGLKSTRLQSTHHPFTSPKTAEDVDLLMTNPEAAIADHYDLVVNGVEVGGGSRRVHNAAVQRFIMEQVLELPVAKVEEFAHLLEALRAGCPPHAGFALGFDRFIAVLLGERSVRNVMAFPKWGKGDDPLVKAPARVSDEDWQTYKLKPTS